MQKNQAGGNEQCCATSVFVLHLLWGVDYTKCRANQNSCEESEITFHASNGAAQRGPPLHVVWSGWFASFLELALDSWCVVVGSASLCGTPSPS